MATPHRRIRDSIVVGFIGYAAVALFYSAFDLLAARGTLFTVNVLGRAVFRGWRDPALLQFPLEMDRVAIVAYNTLHFVLAIVIGFVVVRLVAIGEEQPARRSMVRVVIPAGYVVTVVAVGVATAPIRALVPWWSIILANAAAAMLAGAYLVATHPGLWRRLKLVAA